MTSSETSSVASNNESIAEDNIGTLDECAKLLSDAIADQKNFKKDNKDIFVENRQHSKRVKELKHAVLTRMEEKGLTSFTGSGVEIEIKNKVKESHDKNLLASIIDADKYSEYMGHVSNDTQNLVARSAKKGSSKKRKVSQEE